MRSKGKKTFFRRVRSSSLRSRSVVVGAVQTLCRSEPRERIFFFSSSLSVRGRCRSRRSSSASAAARSRKRFSHSVSSPRATSLFHCQTPLSESCIVVRFELLYGELCCFKSRWRQGFEKSIDDG